MMWFRANCPGIEVKRTVGQASIHTYYITPQTCSGWTALEKEKGSIHANLGGNAG